MGRVRGDAQQLGAVTTEGGILGGQLQHAEDGVHGGTDLVAHGGEEVALGPAGAVGLQLRLAQGLFQLLAVRDVDPTVDHPADGALGIEVGHHPVIDVDLPPFALENPIGEDGLALLQHLGEVPLQGGDALGVDPPFQSLDEGMPHDVFRTGTELGQVFAVAQQYLAALVPHHYGVGLALPQRPDESHLGLQLLAGGLLGAGQPLEHEVAIEQHQRQGEEHRKQQVEGVGVALHEAGLRQFAVAPLVARHGQLVGRDGEQSLVEDPHQHLVAGQAGKAHQDGFLIGGAGDAQPGLRIVVQGMAGKIERHYGGVQSASLDGLHCLLGALHGDEPAALELIGEWIVAGHPYAPARQTLQRAHALLALMGEDHVDVVRGIGDRGAQAIALGHGPGDGTDEIEAPRADGLVPLPVGVEADELEGEAGALAHLGQHVDRHAGELAVVIQGAIGVEVVHQPHPDGGRLAHPGKLHGVIALARAVIHVTNGPVPLAEDGIAGSLVDGVQAVVDEAEQGRHAGG